MSPISGGARYGSGARKTGRPGSGSSGWPTTGSRNRESVIRGQRVASPLDTRGGSRMPESGPYGSVRGARGNSRPYRDRGFYIQRGKIKLTVVSERGREAVVGILGPSHFFGEGCLNGHPLRITTAKAIDQSLITRI